MMISVEGVVVVRAATERFLAELSVVVRLGGFGCNRAALWLEGGASQHLLQPIGRIWDRGTLRPRFPARFPDVTL